MAHDDADIPTNYWYHLLILFGISWKIFDNLLGDEKLQVYKKNSFPDAWILSSLKLAARN